MPPEDAPPRLTESITEPMLTPQFCFNTTALRDFLRLSRATVDDSISAQLNALLTPSKNNPYAPSSPEAASQSSRSRGGLQRHVPPQACSAFKTQVLFPSWSARTSVLSYCHRVSEGAVEGSSQAASQSMDTTNEATRVQPTGLSAQAPRNYWGREQVTDERLDPYSARDYEWTRVSRAQELGDLLRNEESTERIVRSRTWGVLLERCAGTAGSGGTGTASDGTWEKEWRGWKRRKNGESILTD